MCIVIKILFKFIWIQKCINPLTRQQQFTNWDFLFNLKYKISTMILLWNSILKRTWIEYYQGIKCVYRSKPNEWRSNLINQRFGLNKFNIFNEFIFT